MNTKVSIIEENGEKVALIFNGKEYNLKEGESFLDLLNRASLEIYKNEKEDLHNYFKAGNINIIQKYTKEQIEEIIAPEPKKVPIAPKKEASSNLKNKVIALAMTGLVAVSSLAYAISQHFNKAELNSALNSVSDINISKVLEDAQNVQKEEVKQEENKQQDEKKEEVKQENKVQKEEVKQETNNNQTQKVETPKKESTQSNKSETKKPQTSTKEPSKQSSTSSDKKEEPKKEENKKVDVRDPYYWDDAKNQGYNDAYFAWTEYLNGNGGEPAYPSSSQESYKAGWEVGENQAKQQYKIDTASVKTMSFEIDGQNYTSSITTNDQSSEIVKGIAR